MAYDNIVSRTDASALMPEQVSNAILAGLQNESAALTLFQRVMMARGQVRLPVLSALPTAYFVTGDTGLKQTTEANWANKYLNAEEIAAIVPIPDAVLEDAEFDAWATVIPLVQAAIGRTLDAAIFFGVNKPASWPADIVAAAHAVSDGAHEVVEGHNAAAAGGIAGDFSDLFALLENEGSDPSAIVANTSVKGKLRQARSTQGVRLEDTQDGSVFGVTPSFPMRGLWPTGSGKAEAIVLDRSNFILGVRRDITIDRSNEAVIQDGSGAIVYNSFQQDLTLVRLTARFAFQVANVIRYDEQTEANRYPAATLLTA